MEYMDTKSGFQETKGWVFKSFLSFRTQNDLEYGYIDEK